MATDYKKLLKIPKEMPSNIIIKAEQRDNQKANQSIQEYNKASTGPGDNAPSNYESK